MTSHFASLALCYAAMSCGGASTIERSLSLDRPVATRCTATVGGLERPANTYVFEVLRLTGVAVGVEANDLWCQQCLDGESSVPCVLEQRHCRCSESVPVALENLREQVRGLRFANLPGGTYCFRLAAFEVPGRTDQTDCPCEGSIGAIAKRACALSPPVHLTEDQGSESISMPLVCRDDPVKAKLRCSRSGTSD